jgi:hypothetical protein
MWWIHVLVHGAAHAGHGTTAEAQGRTTKVVRCEACGQYYEYGLKRTAHGPSWQQADADLQHLLAIGIEVIPCPACGWYQSGMIPKARRLHRRWMMYGSSEKICNTASKVKAT